MDKHIETYLKDRGFAVASDVCRGDEGGDPGYSEWFKTKILGLDTAAYRREFWCEVRTTGHTIGHVPRTLNTLMREKGLWRSDARIGFLIELALLQGAIYPFWILGRLLAREVTRLRRGTYYEKERARRWRLADERVAIRVRRTANACPTLDAVRSAWQKVHATRGHAHTLAVLSCGALLEDLECYVDNHARTVRGVPGIRGRAPGIKGLFRDQAPDLFAAYKNIMRCKALAKKYRQAVGCPDPIPTAAVLPVSPAVPPSPPVSPPPAPPPASPPHPVSPPPAPESSCPCDFAAERFEAKSEEVGGMVFPLMPCLENVEKLRAWMASHGNTAYLRTRAGLVNPEMTYTNAHLLPPGAREAAVRILSFGDGSLVAVEAAIALRIDPACVQAGSSCVQVDPAYVQSDPSCVRLDPAVCVRRAAGGRKVPPTPRRVRAWLLGPMGQRAREGAVA